MEIGKVSETILKRSVFKQLQVKRDEVLIGPGIGEDCSVLAVEEDEAIVLSTDPITGTEKGIGELAVHITLNDLAASGAEPIGLMVTLLLPLNYGEGDLKTLMKEMNEITHKYKVQIIGGHSEVTKAVHQAIVSVTGVGKIKKDKVMTGKKAPVGSDIIMTKSAGIEGTTILAKEAKDKLLEKYNEELITDAKSLHEKLSVVDESRIAMNYTCYAMHDVTEGGIFGALWEIGVKLDTGFLVEQEKIPVLQSTVEICEFFAINPYKLIGSGSMVIVTDQGNEMIDALHEAGIEATIIGRTTQDNNRVIRSKSSLRSVTPAQRDELYVALDAFIK